MMIGNLATSFEDEVNVRLYISDEATDEQISSLDSYLKTLENDAGNIASVEFRNKDQVLEDFQRQTANNPDIVNQLDGQPAAAYLRHHVARHAQGAGHGERDSRQRDLHGDCR